MEINSAYDTPENIFRFNCIYDYIYFIRTFFLYYNENDQIKEDLFKYFLTGNISVFNLSNSNSNRLTKEILKKLYKSNKNKLLQGSSERNLFGGAPKKILSLIVPNRNNENSSLGKTPRSNNENSSLGKTPRSNRLNFSASFLSLKNTPPQSGENLFKEENLFLNKYSTNVFKTNNHHFRSISTSGQQSNMMISPDNKFYFKKYSSKQPAQTKKHLENECRVYTYLRDISPDFLENCTCFVNCFKNGILLKNGGSSLEEMLKKKTFIFNKEFFNQFFFKLYSLHQLLVTLGDFHVGNVVGYYEIRFIDLGHADIHPPGVYDDDFLKMIHQAFSGLFFALCAKYNIN
jgi:hypothetical protein